MPNVFRTAGALAKAAFRPEVELTGKNRNLNREILSDRRIFFSFLMATNIEEETAPKDYLFARGILCKAFVEMRPK